MASRSIQLVSALILFVGTASAQATGGKVFARYDKPLKYVTLDLATGTLTRHAVSARGAATVVDFANNDLSGFVGVDTGAGFCEWFDAGVKGTGLGATSGVDNVSDVMNSIVFAYCSAALGTSSGGPGGAVKLGFYEGYTAFGGAPTTAVAALTLTGLPANSASSSFFGGFNCLLIRIVFGAPVLFADGPIGYSWKFLDNGTGTINPQGAIMAATWPFLSCTNSCSSTYLGVDGQGMTDVIDQFCPPGFLRTTFTFGTTSGSFTSMAMEIEEIVDTPATVMEVNSSAFPNPDGLCSIEAIVGHTIDISVTLGLARSKGAPWIAYFGTNKVNPPTGTPIPQFTGSLNFGAGKAGRMLLCSLDTGGGSVSGAHTGVSGSSSTATSGLIPFSLALVGNPWCTQAIILGPVSAADGGGNARLSAMVIGEIGNF